MAVDAYHLTEQDRLTGLIPLGDVINFAVSSVMINHQIQQRQWSALLSCIFLATSNLLSCACIEESPAVYGVRCFAGFYYPLFWV